MFNLSYKERQQIHLILQSGDWIPAPGCLPFIRLGAPSETSRMRSYVKIFLLANKKKYIHTISKIHFVAIEILRFLTSRGDHVGIVTSQKRRMTR